MRASPSLGCRKEGSPTVPEFTGPVSWEAGGRPPVVPATVRWRDSPGVGLQGATGAVLARVGFQAGAGSAGS